MTAASSASTLELPAFRNRFRSLSQLSNHLVVAQLLQLNQQNHRLKAELLLFLGELDRRQLYREQAVASAFEYCVARLGYSEDVAWKRVGAARLMRQFPRIYELLSEGRIHLTALMLLKPHLTDANHEEWLLLACEKSKRQVEKLMAPLSSSTYRVTFTASERLKQKLDRAGELLSHCINPSDLPALIERALDGLLERAEKRRYGARPTSISRATECPLQDDSLRRAQPSSAQSAVSSSAQSAQPSTLRADGLDHESCQDPPPTHPRAKDPDPVSPSDGRSNAIDQPAEQQVAAAPQRALNIGEQRNVASPQRASTIDEQTHVASPQHATPAKSKRRRCLPVGVRRAVFERDGGQCTFIGCEGRRCSQRHFLEFDHIEPHALGGPETVSNLRLRCSEHNRLEAEKLFGRERVKSAVKHAKQERSRHLNDDRAE